MDKFDELLQKLKGMDKTQSYMDWEENIPSDIWDIFIQNNYRLMAEGLEIDEHRWYERSTVVIKIFGRFLGINLVTKMYSEQNEIDDICAELFFFEMDPIQTVTYIRQED